MLSRSIYDKQRRGRKWLSALGMLAVITSLMFVGSSALALTQSEFELDKNATNNLTTEHLGTLKSNVSAGAGSFVVCERQFDPPGPDPIIVVPIPSTPFTILVDGEQMTVTGFGSTANTGGCGFKDPADSTAQARTWNVTRGVNGTTAASHSGGSDVTHMLTATVAGDDWDQVYAEITEDANDIGDDDKCVDLGAVECVWVHDDFGVSVFTTGGSKDDLNINPLQGESGGGWRWTDSSVPDADEILDAFAAKYSVGGRELLFFGADRYATNGAKDFGFWFFRSPVSLNTDGTFTGNHTRPTNGLDGVPGGGDDTRGDILLLGTFTNGGAVTNLRVFEWYGTGGNTNGTLQSLTSLGDCGAGGGSPEGCNTVNNTTVPSPWPYTGKSAPATNKFYSGAFMEGGIDLTALGLQGCFASFMAETRSAPEPGAQLKDFALGNFESCGATVVTTPQDGTATAADLSPLTNNGGTSLPDVSIGTGSVQVKDAAVLNVTGTTVFTGTMSFSICGPIASGTCATGGVASGSVAANANGTYVSNAATLTSVGRYCWRADWTSTTPGLTAGASDSSLTECFEVLPVTPALSTQALGPLSTPVSGPVNFGDSVSDLAFLEGTATQPGTNGGTLPANPPNPASVYPSINATNGAPAGGTITFELRGPNTCVATVVAGNPHDVTVTGDGSYYSNALVPPAPGDYHWVATYSGSSPNTLGTSHNTDCTDTDEDVTVQKLQPTIGTAQNFVPNDSATITVTSGAGDLAGTVTFYMWVNDATCGGGDLGTADYTTNPAINVATGTGTGTSRTVVSNNSTAYSVSGTTFHWVVVFDSTNPAHFDVTSGCGNEHSSITINNGVTQPSAP